MPGLRFIVMKWSIIALIALCLSNLWAEASIYKLASNDFCLYVNDYKGNNQYPSGLRVKIGMKGLIDENPIWNYYHLGSIEGRELNTSEFIVNRIDESLQGKTRCLNIVLNHRYMHIQALIKYTAYADTGVITTKVELKNTGSHYPLRLSDISSTCLSFPKGEYVFRYFTSGWAQERKLHEVECDSDTIRLCSLAGRSSAKYSPWVTLCDTISDCYYTAQLAWSGNWFANLVPGRTPSVIMGEYFDNGELLLLPGESLLLPEVAFTGGYGTMDAPANNLHRYQRLYLNEEMTKRNTMPIQFNTWFPLQIDVCEDSVKAYADVASRLGIEVFTIDSGWFVEKEYETEVGNWNTNQRKFPGGMRKVADYIRSKGMKFGLWFELESVGENSQLLKQHPEWCLQYDGKPVVCEEWSRRRHLDFSRPEVFRWALQQFDNLYEECGGIDWVKLDYNISIGSSFTDKYGVKTGKCMRNHILALYNWLDSLSVRYPNLIIENCSSGAQRMDLGMLAHTHASFVSDETSPEPELGMAWSSTLEYTPRMVNHWVVGMQNNFPFIDESLSDGYLDYIFRIPMNGHYGISSSITSWSPRLMKLAEKNIRLYKRIRGIIADGDCFHLTTQPDYTDPEGWTAMAYAKSDSVVAIVTRCYGGNSAFVLKLPMLSKQSSYKVQSVDGNPAIYKGEKLINEGIEVALKNYRTEVFTVKKIK